MSKNRRGGRDLRSHRVIDATVGFHRLAEGSVLYRSEGTVILVTASVDESVPRFMEGSGRGWVTAEYQLHPRANPQRREARDGRVKPLSGRSKEIERLIGRALRSAVIPERLGERTIVIDCDVLEADGGTRTASITAGWVALAVALERLRVKGLLTGPPLRDQVAAISVGHVDGELALDLCYAEDSMARVDLNVVGTATGSIVELQGTAEGEAVPRVEMDSMIDLGLLGVTSLCDVQRGMLQTAGVVLGSLLAKRG
jgi:ribonuclease PH